MNGEKGTAGTSGHLGLDTAIDLEELGRHCKGVTHGRRPVKLQPELLEKIRKNREQPTLWTFDDDQGQIEAKG